MHISYVALKASCIAETSLLQWYFFCVSDEACFDFPLKAIMRWKLMISFSPWELTVICFTAYFTLSLKSCVVAAANIMAWTERGEIVEMGSKGVIRVKDCTEPSPAFLMADQTEFPLFEHKSSKILTQGRWSQKKPSCWKCFAGSGPERLVNIFLLHWFHAKCPCVYRELFFLECLKTVLHYKLYRKKLLQPVLQYICVVVCCSG